MREKQGSDSLLNSCNNSVHRIDEGIYPLAEGVYSFDERVHPFLLGLAVYGQQFNCLRQGLVALRESFESFVDVHIFPRATPALP